MASKIVFSVVVLLVLAQLGLGLRCYKCSTQEHGEACAKPQGNSKFIEECTENQVCYTRYHVNTEEGKYIYNRSCRRSQWTCWDPKIVFTGCQVCPYDLCNTYVYDK